MRHPYARRVLSLLSSLLMALSLCAPAAAWAKDVEVANHTRPGGATVVSGLRIDGVSAPVPGCALDGTATVTAEPGASWEVPVLWVRDDLELATTVEEGRSYLPAIAFFVPEGYAVEGDAYEVALSESLTALFGGAEVVSVYDAATGVTYILPASLRAFFGRRATAEAAGRVAEGADVSQGGADTVSAEAAQEPAGVEQGNPRPCPGGPDKGMVPDQGEEPEEGEDKPKPKPKPKPGQSLVEVYCAQTAMDAISEEDLEWLCDLVVTRLEPQAANLLAESFPAFANASADELGTEIGLYVYYSTGDKDGVPEHDNISPGVAAFVVSTADSSQRYCYMIGVNAMGLQAIDEDGNLVRDGATGKLRLARDGSGMVELENTIVHELLHAFMDDYNRTGMAGVTNIKEYVATQDWESMTDEQKECFKTVSFPTWFIEGTATTTENVFQARHPLFEGLRKGVDGEMQDRYTQVTLVERYVGGRSNDVNGLYDLKVCTEVGNDDEGDATDAVASAYVSGYLAVLYLSDLASIKTTGVSAITYQDGVATGVDTERLREGMSTILERLHTGETLDQVIADISPVGEEGAKLYQSTDDFTDKFIKGPETGRDGDGRATYAKEGDAASSGFVTDYLNYLLNICGQEDRTHLANGSILFPADRDFASPLDATGESLSNYYRIAGTNKAVPSTVPNEVAFAGGGKSDADVSTQASDTGTTPAAPSVAQEVTDIEPEASVAVEADAAASMQASVSDRTEAASDGASDTSTTPAVSEVAQETGEATSIGEPVGDAVVGEPSEVPGAVA